MIEGSSILPLIAAFFGAFLATYSLWTAGQGRRTRFFFSVLCTITATWAFGQFLVLNAPGVVDPLIVSPGSPMHWVGALMILAAGAAPAYWLLFAASISGHTKWTYGWRLALLHALPAYVFVVGATNAWHGLFVTQGAEGLVMYGPLSHPYIIVMYIYIVAGSWMIWRGARSDHRNLEVRQANTIMWAILIPLAGGILWNTRHLSGVNINVNPVPSLFIVFDAVIAFEVFRGRLIDLLPDSTRAVMDASEDAVIIVDDTLAIRAINTTASKVYPGVEIGTNLHRVAPEVGRHASFCLEYHCDDLSFEVETHGRVYWGRVRRAGAHDSHPGGCVILLSDLTDLRRAQRELLRAGRTADGQPAGSRYSEWVSLP